MNIGRRFRSSRRLSNSPNSLIKGINAIRREASATADFFICFPRSVPHGRALAPTFAGFSRLLLFRRSFSWALLQANSCVLQLRGFCFPGSALTHHHWVPSHKAAARFGSRSPRFWVPQENGARKRRKFSYVL